MRGKMLSPDLALSGSPKYNTLISLQLGSKTVEAFYSFFIIRWASVLSLRLLTNCMHETLFYIKNHWQYAVFHRKWFMSLSFVFTIYCYNKRWFIMFFFWWARLPCSSARNTPFPLVLSDASACSPNPSFTHGTSACSVFLSGREIQLRAFIAIQVSHYLCDHLVPPFPGTPRGHVFLTALHRVLS